MIKDMVRYGIGAVAATAVGLAAWAGPALAQTRQPEDIRIVFVTHGQANDVYWTVVKNGMQAAAERMGVTVEYFAPETWDVVRMARMIEAATASNPDGLVVSIPDPTALEAPIRAAEEAGIPIIVIDTGFDQVEPWGLDLFVGGGSEYENGVRAAGLLADAGVTAAICVNQEVGNVSLDMRCNGLTDGLAAAGGTVEVVAVTMDPTDSTRRTEAFLTAHPEVDGIVTLGPSVGGPILGMLKERGILEDYTFGTFDLSPEVLDALDKGEMLFAVDNQQYMMGYLPVVFLTMKAMYATFPTDTVWTGPGFVTQADAAAVRDLSQQGIR